VGRALRNIGALELVGLVRGQSDPESDPTILLEILEGQARPSRRNEHRHGVAVVVDYGADGERVGGPERLVARPELHVRRTMKQRDAGVWNHALLLCGERLLSLADLHFTPTSSH